MRTKQILILTLLTSALYLLQFLVFPKLLPNYYARSSEATAIFVLTFLLCIGLGVGLVSDRIVEWIIPDAVYLILTRCYSANRAYGVNYDSFSRPPHFLFVFLIALALMLAAELLGIGAAAVIRKFAERRR